MNTLVLIIIGFPILEIIFMIKVGQLLGAINTVLLMLLTAIMGVFFARIQGLSALKSGFSNIYQNKIPIYEIISVKRDKENNIIEGNPDKIKVVTDYWRFSKYANSKNPNWHLCEIINK